MSTRVEHKFPGLSTAKCESVETTREYKSGAIFIGTVQDNKKTGSGEFSWPSGARYIGEFVDNKRHGKGRQEWADGSFYEGDFVEDVRHGQGTHTWGNQESYTGTFFKDRRHGAGEYKWPNGSQYKGTFYLDKQEGYGTLLLSNGNKFEGLYKSGEREGPGVLTYPDDQQDVGLWHREKLVCLCTPVDGAFTMMDHQEFDYDPKEQVMYIDPDSINNRMDIFDSITQPPSEFTYMPDSRVPNEVEKLFRENLDSQSLAMDIMTFHDEFFKDYKSTKKGKSKKDEENKQEKEKIVAWNKTPSCIAMQKHVLKHEAKQNSVSFNVEKVLKGQREGFGKPGPLEQVSIKLLQSAKAGKVEEVADLLLQGQVFVDVADVNGHTPLLGAAVNWHQEVINCLLDNGADINKLNNEGVSALAACHIFFYPIERFKYNIAERYLEKPPDFEQEAIYDVNEIVKGILHNSPKRRPASSSEKKGQAIDAKKILKLRQEYGAKVSIAEGPAVEYPGSEDSGLPISPHQAQEIKIPVEDGGMSLDNESVSGRKLGVLQVKRSPWQNLDREDEETFFEDYDDFRDAECATQLSDFESETSVRNLDIDVTDQLIDRCASHLSTNDMVVGRQRSADSNRQSIGTARRLAMDKSHHSLMESTIRLLLKRGADPNASSVPMPVLFFAVKAADVDAVRCLLMKNASTSARLSDQKGGLLPLHIASAIPGEEGVLITELLLDSLGHPDTRATEDDSFLNRNLEEEWSKDIISEKSKAILGGRTALHIACARDDNYRNACKVVHLLLDHHADPNLLCNGWSPLALAIASGNDLAVEELLGYGADPSLTLTHGMGSTLCAASSTEYEHRRTPDGRIHLIDRLIKAGANILAPIPIGPKRIMGTAVDYAYYMFNLDRRIAHMPYHALTHAERETYNARRRLLGHMGDLLRLKAVERERMKLEEDEREGRRSVSPSPNFVYTGAGAPLPPGFIRPRMIKGGAVDGHVTFDGVPPEAAASTGSMDPTHTRKPIFKYCYECGRSVGVRLSACTRCKEVYYCSKACKLKAWNARHKEECIRVGGRSRSPSPGGKVRIDSPTPATDPDRAHKGKGITLPALAGKNGAQRIKVPIKGLSHSAKLGGRQGPTKNVKFSSLANSPEGSSRRPFMDNYSFV